MDGHGRSRASEIPAAGADGDGNVSASHPLVPDELLRPIVEYFQPRRVILFGSAARGETGPDSDIDLLVVLDDDAPPEKLAWRAVSEARQGYTKAADVIPCRESVLMRRARAIGSFAHAILAEGVTVYERK
jgi:Nucleotidyltransferase domain